MPMFRRFTAMVALAVALVAAPALAQQYFMRVPGIPGESTTRGFEGWIGVSSFSLGFAAGQCSSLMISKAMDSTSPQLIPATMTGQVFGSIDLAALSSGAEGVVTFRLRLLDAIIESVSEGGATGGGEPSESLAIQPAQVELTYYRQTETGAVVPVSATFDCAKVKGR